MSPTLSKLPLKNESDSHFVHLIHNLLTASECKEIIETHTPNLISVHGAHSSRTRHIYHDAALSELLWNRLAPFYGSTMITDEESQTWTAKELNPCFRFCAYKAGDAFGPHVDGKRLISVNKQSFMTVNIYLNTVPNSSGGATRVLSDFGVDERFEVLGRIQPEEGMAAVFRDALFHDGEVLSGGEKFLLRTDVIFERDVDFDFEVLYRGCNGGRKAMDLAVRLEDGGNSDEAAAWYATAFRLDPTLERARKALDMAIRLEDGGNYDEAARWYSKAFKLDPALERGV